MGSRTKLQKKTQPLEFKEWQIWLVFEVLARFYIATLGCVVKTYFLRK